jgi:hypothetical protein
MRHRLKGRFGTVKKVWGQGPFFWFLMIFQGHNRNNIDLLCGDGTVKTGSENGKAGGKRDGDLPVQDKLTRHPDAC